MRDLENSPRQKVIDGLARMHRVASASRDNLEPYMGPYRPQRAGEKVEEGDVNANGWVPERIYGGRGTKLAVPVERRKPQGNS